jgi:hypothetical protein
VNAVDYARVPKVVCGKKATVNYGAAISGTFGTAYQAKVNLLKISTLSPLRRVENLNQRECPESK